MATTSDAALAPFEFTAKMVYRYVSPMAGPGSVKLADVRPVALASGFSVLVRTTL